MGAAAQPGGLGRREGAQHSLQAGGSGEAPGSYETKLIQARSSSQTTVPPLLGGREGQGDPWLALNIPGARSPSAGEGGASSPAPWGGHAGHGRSVSKPGTVLPAGVGGRAFYWRPRDRQGLLRRPW